jgi:ribosomal protein S12 methylthiotransferase accessory factor
MTPRSIKLEKTYFNAYVELLDATYGPEKQGQYDLVPKLYNLLIGPLTSVNIYRPELSDLPMYGTSAKHAPVGTLIRDMTYRTSSFLETVEIPCGGKGLTMQQAFLGTMGEHAERLLAALHSGAVLEQYEHATYDELFRQGRRALGPDDVPLFANEQYAQSNFNYVPFRSDMELTWVEGTDMLTGESILVPAQLVVFQGKLSRTEPLIGYTTTGGLVFHPNRRRAILHGIYENLERDAINLRWYCKLPPPRIDVDLVRFLRSHLSLRRPRISTPFIEPIRVLLNTVDIGIPVFTVTTVDRSRRTNAFLAGGGAWGNRNRALVQALGEIGQMRTGLRLARNEWAHIQADSSVSDLTDFFYASVYYGYAENLPKLSWYTAGEHSVPWSDVPSLPSDDLDAEYEATIELLRAADINPILFDFSSACWSGVWVTKVFMPQVTQAHIPSHPYFGHPRYYEMPRRLSTTDRRLSLAELNPDPLPFP